VGESFVVDGEGVLAQGQLSGKFFTPGVTVGRILLIRRVD
jgi:hypothetical protein